MVRPSLDLGPSVDLPGRNLSFRFGEVLARVDFEFHGQRIRWPFFSYGGFAVASPPNRLIRLIILRIRQPLARLAFYRLSRYHPTALLRQQPSSLYQRFLNSF